MYLDELGPEHLGDDGTYAEFLDGKLIQSAEDPPDFVLAEWVREPDIIWRYDAPLRPNEPKRLYDFRNPRELEPLAPSAWLDLLRANGANRPRMRVAQELAKYADHRTGLNVRPANGTIAQALGIARESVNRAIKGMVADGWLAQTGKGPKGVITYALSLPVAALDAA